MSCRPGALRRSTVPLRKRYTDGREVQQELSYRQQITRQLRTQYAEGIYKHTCYTVTLKSRLRVTQDHAVLNAFAPVLHCRQISCTVAENYLWLVINARRLFKVKRSCFRTFGAKVLGIFVLMIRQFHRNESSWNLRSRGTKVPQERKFQGANVPWNESSTGAKVLSVDFSLLGTKVQRNEKAWNRQNNTL